MPAIVEGTADRLRPVLLTTLTTVLGLAPLLFERSAQAQFLKPTVITLVYGLGFGMVLVLLVVPALMAMQQDAARMNASIRRAFSRRGGAAGVMGGALLAGAAGLFAVTMLPAMRGGGGAAGRGPAGRGAGDGGGVRPVRGRGAAAGAGAVDHRLGRRRGAHPPAARGFRLIARGARCQAGACRT